MKPSLNHSLGNEASYYSTDFDPQMGLKANDTLNQSKNTSKDTSLDLKKLDLSKNPTQSSSSLEFLILLINRSLKFSIQQILGLFTNNNKYLAHIIVKGINQKFDGLRLFFELINQNISTLERLFQQNQDDALACLYALKPGFISKDEQCASYTIDIFQRFGKQIYDWFISTESKCNQTLLLGLKRHEKLSQNYAQLLLSIIDGNQVEYFSTKFMASTSSEIQFYQITSKLIPYFQKKQKNENNESLVDLLENNGVFQKWFQIAEKLYESEDMDSKLIFIDFIGDFMIWLPTVIERNAPVTNLLRRNWENMKTSQFIVLVNQIMINMERLILAQSPISLKLLNIIADIFNQTYRQQEKRQFIVQGLLTILQKSHELPTDIFIAKFPSNHIISACEFVLINETVKNLKDQLRIIKITDFLKDLFFFDILHNQSLSGLIIQALKKVLRSGSKQNEKFINILLKNSLSNYVTLFVKLKNHQKIAQNQDQLSSDKKKNSNKPQSTTKSQIAVFNKKMDLTMNLAEKTIDLILSSKYSELYVQSLKNYVLGTNSQIKKINFGMGTKRIINLLQKKLKVTKQQEIAFQELNQNQVLTKSGFRPSESLTSGKPRQIYEGVPSLSRIQVPDKISKQFDAIVAKRKKDEEIKEEQSIRKKKEQQFKKILHKKELQKMNLIKGGFGEGEAQLKQEGFWNRFVKETQEVRIYLNPQIQDSHLQNAQLIMKKYSKLFKYFFTKYSNTMYSSKTSNFDQNSQRKELLSAVEIIKFLKEYTLILATNLQQVQTMIKDINIKIFQRKQVVNEVDFQGFEEFIRQFCLCIWSRNQWRLGSKQNNLKFDHLNLPELLMNFIIYLRNVFKVKGQNMNLFDVGEVDIKNSSPQVQQLNEKLEINPNYILPEGFKKITNKKIDEKPFIKEGSNLPQSYAVTLQVLDGLIYDKLGIHIIESQGVKAIKFTARPYHQINVKQRDPIKIKARALSTMIDRKTAIYSPLGLIASKTQLSKGIKKGMLYLKPDDKFIGQQVAFKFQQILNKITGYQILGQIQPNKLKNIQKLSQPEVKRSYSLQKIQPLQKKIHPSNTKLLIVEKSENYVLSKKQKKLEIQRKSQEKIQLKSKRKKQDDQKYFVELKLKLEDKKSNQIKQFSKIRAAQQKERQIKRQKKLKIQEFTSKQVEKYKNMFQQIIDKKRRIQEDKQIKNQDEQQKMRRIRQKIESENKVFTQIRKQTTQGIVELLYGQTFKSLIKQYEIPLKTVFQYLQKHSANPLSKKKTLSGQIDAQTWVKFNKIFEISPLIVTPKDVITIFKNVVKDKIAKKEYSVGINYEEFLHCMLRECIKQKTIFSKIAQRIKDEKRPIDQQDAKIKKSKSVAKKIQSKNEFEQEEQTDIKKLLKQPDMRDDITDHYGDISKFNLDSFKGLIYYLKMPFTKKGQQARIKELIEMDNKKQTQYTSNLQKLKEKLKMQYRLQKNEKKKDTANPQTTKVQKTEIKIHKNQSKLINQPVKTDAKQKSVNKSPNIVNSKKTIKK